MKTALIILGACLVVLFLASGVTFIATFQSKRNLRVTNQELEARLRVGQAKSEALIAETEKMASQIQKYQELTENLQSQVTDLSTGNSDQSAPEGKPPAVAPYQAQAYLGKKPIGWVWIVPQNLRMDTNAQRYVYEPIVWMDESLRKQFVTHHTNIVEREVETVNYVTPTYYSEPIYYASWPVYPSHPIHRPPGMTNRPPISTLPSTPIQPLPQQPFNPGNGTITMQKLGTASGAIKTRPSP